MNWLLGLYFTYRFQSDRYNVYDANFYEPGKWPYSGKASSRGTQRLLSVKNLFREENIALNFLFLEDGRI